MTAYLQETIDAITEVLNNKVHPPEWNAQMISILKPIDWKTIPEDTEVQNVPAWKVWFRKINGKWVFWFLLEENDR